MRAIARRLYEAVRDLPIISPHGHVDPRLLLDDEPFPDPASLFVTPDHYVTRLLHASGVGLDALGVGAGPARRGRRRARCGGCCARTGTSSAGRRCGTGSRPSWPRSSTCRAAAVGRDGGRDLRPDRRAPRRRTPTGRARSTSGSGIAVLATTDDPCGRPVRARRARGRPDLVGPGHPDVPARPLPRAGAGRAGRDAVASLGKAADVDTGDYAGFVRALEARRRLLRRARRDVGRPQPRRRPHRPARAGRGGADLPGGAGRRGHGGRGGRVPAAHAARDGADVVRRRARR